MSSYTKTRIPSGKEMLGKYYKNQLDNLKFDDEVVSVELYPTSVLPGIAAKSKSATYTKTKTPLSADGKNTFDVIRKDGEFDSFIWHTTADKVKEAVRWGIVKTQSVTSQTIGALGKYRLVYLDRFKNRKISNRFVLKDKLLSLYQDRFEALEELESLANQDRTKDEFEYVFKHYTDRLIEIKNDLKKRFSKTKFSKADHLGRKHIEKEIDDDIARAKRFLERYQFEAANRATGIDSILTFVKAEMVRNLRNLQNHNQNITYSRAIHYAATRGELNSFIEDAEKIIEDYNAPPRDAIFADHHGYYGFEGDRAAYDSSFHCASPEEEERAAFAITFIEKMNGLNLSNLTIETDKDAVQLKTVYATRWSVDGGFIAGVKRVAAWFANVAIKLAVGIVELPLTMVIEPLTFGHAKPFFEAVRKLAIYEIKVTNPPEFAGSNTILKDVQRKTETLGLRIRHLAANAFKNTFQDFFAGAKDIYDQLSVHLFDDIPNDYFDGSKKIPNLDAVLNLGEKEIERIAADEKVVWRRLDYNIQKISNNKISLQPFSFEPKTLEEILAIPGFIPSAGEFRDALNAGADGAEQFMAFFLHNIHAKHPLAGILFSLSYTAGGLAVLMPQYVAFLGAQYIAFSKALGYSMSKSAISAGISSAVTQAQITAAFYELLLDGKKSWIAKGATAFEKDPFTSLIYMGTAVGFGYLVIYQFHIPWLSELLKDDMGTFPPTSWAFIGAKLGVLVHELLSEDNHQELENTENAKKLRQYLTDLYKKAHPNETNENVNKTIDESMRKLLSAETIESLQKAYADLQNNSEVQKINAKTKKLVDEQVQRNRIMQFLANNRERLIYLSAQTKHQLAQQFKQHFPFDQALSLKKMLYPEESASILRTTLKIIFAYPAFLVRLGAAVVSSIMQRNVKPLQSAGTDFGLKILKDITRVGRATGKTFKSTCTFFRRHFKTFADVFMNSFLARAQAVVANRHDIANAGYSASGALDANYEKARQLVGTPVDAGIRKTTIPHPVNTERKNGSSYIQALSKLFDPSSRFSTCSLGPLVKAPSKLSANDKQLTQLLEPQPVTEAHNGISARI